MSDPVTTGALVAIDGAEFSRLIAPGTPVRKLAGGFGFIEGPSWSDDGEFLVFSDIPRDRMHRWSARDGVSIHREPTGNTNGNTRDGTGRLISCEHSGRRVAVEDASGQRSTLVDTYRGKRLNSPNDVVVRSDGTIWFTDPPYGLPADGAGRELERNHVFRLDPRDGSLVSVADGFVRPNGLCFSPDETRLYVADSSDRAHVRAFDIDRSGRLHGGAPFCHIDPGIPDGIRSDVDGRLWASAGDGVHVFGADGHLIGKVVTPHAPSRRDPSVIAPETVANLCFGGSGQAVLFMTACTSLYAIDVNVRGATQGRTG